MNHSRTRRLPALTLTVAIAAVCVAACGSSSSSGSASNSSSSSASSASAAADRSGSGRATLVACLKSHGVTLPARPAGAGAGGTPPAGGARRGLFGGGAGGRFANNPKLRAAFQACGGGRGFGGRRPAPSHAAITTFVACVKQHGYNLPAPNFSGSGPIFPAGIQTNKRFQAASKPCAGDLRPAGAPPGGAGGPANGAPPAA